MVTAYEYPSRFSADKRFLGLHCCTWRSPTPGQAARRPFFALPIEVGRTARGEHTGRSAANDDDVHHSVLLTLPQTG